MQTIVTEYDAEDILIKFKVPVSKRFLVHDLDEALTYSKKMNFPVDLKIISKQVLHKSDIKGLRVCRNELEIVREYPKLMEIVKKRKIRLQGIMIQEYIVGKELLIGIKKDPTFGHVLGFGMGGIYTEYFKEVDFRVCPITMKDANELVDNLRGVELLYGVRGERRSNVPLLKKVLIKVSQIPQKYPKLIELDINPFVLNGKKGVAVDALMLTD